MARPRSDIVPRLLRAARARFLHDGVDGASLREIARTAGTSLGLIHYYFPTKDALFLAVLEQDYAGISDDITAIMAAPEPLEERLRTLFLRIARASDAEFDLMRLVLREVFVSSERRRLVMERFLRGHVPPMLGALMAGQAEGTIDARHPLPAAGLATLCVALFPQILVRVIGDAPAPLPLPPADVLANALLRVLLDGLTPRPVRAADSTPDG